MELTHAPRQAGSQNDSLQDKHKSGKVRHVPGTGEGVCQEQRIRWAHPKGVKQQLGSNSYHSVTAVATHRCRSTIKSLGRFNDTVALDSVLYVDQSYSCPPCGVSDFVTGAAHEPQELWGSPGGYETWFKGLWGSWDR